MWQGSDTDRDTHARIPRPLKDRVGKDGADAGTTIVRIDLDHFKYVIDTMGHEAGNFLLCEVARILRADSETDDLPARVGSDEFVLLLGPGPTLRDGIVLAERILERIRMPKRPESRTIRVGASFGVASTLDGLLPLDEQIIGAESALWEAKDRGRNRNCHHTPGLHRAMLDRRELAHAIRLAIQNEEFEPLFQPRLAGRHDIVAVESLVRWHSPTLGPLAAGAFMPVARQLSVVEEIDEIVFRKAFDQNPGLRSDGIEIPTIAFNVTAERIQDEASYRVVTERVGSGPNIDFEILESMLAEDQTDLFRFSLDRLREAGISIEIDDFGSGHASIIGLMHLMPDAMKIDQRVIAPIVRSKAARALPNQIVGMADLTGLKATAEGVGTMEHARILKELGCDTLQGFAFCRPLPSEDPPRFVMARARAAASAPASEGAAYPGIRAV